MLGYRGLDGLVRRTRLEFSPKPTSLVAGEALFRLRLEPKEEASIFATVSCERGAGHRVADSFHSAFSGLEGPRVGIDGCHITTSSESFNAWLTRSSADLHMLMEGNPEGAYPYAGVPWFNTVFGRDGIITALECLWMAPHISEGVLKYLAETQATEELPEQDAEPGKILHEMRRSEMAALKEVPFARYYGSVDSTPLFVLLAEPIFLEPRISHSSGASGPTSRALCVGWTNMATAIQTACWNTNSARPEALLNKAGKTRTIRFSTRTAAWLSRP